MPSADVYKHSNWNMIDYKYKIKLIKFFYKVFNVEASEALNYLVNSNCKVYNLRNKNNVTVSRFNAYFLKNSLSHRRAILWNIVSNHYTDCTFKAFYRKGKKEKLVSWSLT